MDSSTITASPAAMRSPGFVVIWNTTPVMCALISSTIERSLFDHLRVHPPLTERVTRENAAEERNGGPHALDDRALEHGRHPLDRGHANLGHAEVAPGHLPGPRMLDLEPRVHLEKVEVARGVHEELQRPRVDVPDRSRPRDRGARETVFDRRRQVRRGGLLDELLMAALDRALALVKVDGRPLAVAERLDLDVARAIEVALDVDVAPAERGLGTPGRRRERRRQVLGLVHPRHADAATAGHCLEDHGIPDLASDALGLTGVRHRLVAARHHRDAGGGHQPPRLGLVTHLADGVWRRADEDQARAAARLGEAPVLGEEAVAGMNGIGTARARSLEGPVDVQVALARWWRPHRHGVIRLPDVGRIAIRPSKY